ncbi:hypothetical protein Pure02_16100 [Paenarthrobacter ureafaciens]|nr:hypothetical protein Pure02_16100 [Paenarthrobacter ureafaciens]GLU67635.1 hypothetical protein Pure03_16110 [Paenarthrobacter ureafaciens]
MIGFPISELATPEARSSARAPAILRPWVTVFERSAGMSTILLLFQDRRKTVLLLVVKVPE